MKDFFRLIEISQGSDTSSERRLAVSWGDPSDSGGSPVLLTPPCTSSEELKAAVDILRIELEKILEKAEHAFREGVCGPEAEAIADLSPEEAWSVLSGIEEEAVLMERFNNMPEEARRNVAEHVLAHCSVFSGAGAVFSAHYDSETATLI